MQNPIVSVIVPALDEDLTIGIVIRDTLSAFGALEIKGEIIVVNDGSTDGTKQIAEAYSLSNDTVKFISHDFPMGIGKSFMDGSRIANGDYITMLPGDNENIPIETLKLLKYAYESDVIIPYVSNPKIRGAFRHNISRLFTMVINVSFGTNFNYTNGTNIYRTDLFKKLDIISTGFFYQTEILVKLNMLNADFCQVPYTISERITGDNKAISLKSFISVVKDYIDLIKVRYLNKGRQIL